MSRQIMPASPAVGGGVGVVGWSAIGGDGVEASASLPTGDTDGLLFKIKDGKNTDQIMTAVYGGGRALVEEPAFSGAVLHSSADIPSDQEFLERLMGFEESK